MEAMPLPRRVHPGAGRLTLVEGGWTWAGTNTPRLARAARRLREQLAGVAGTGRGCPVTVSCEVSGEFPALDDDEGYRLAIDGHEARIEAAQEWGVLRAFATLAQLVQADADGPHLPVLTIDDAPRFPWRGLMIDTARHFVRIETLLRTLDAMALFKLNVLHLHLSDDQAFRFASWAFPELADAEQRYSAEELRELVHQAADRGIRVVPELDVPGHVASWLAVHPEWGLGKAVTRPATRFGPHACCLDPANPSAVQAAQALFGELAKVFPDRFVHFGGDEVQLPGGAETDGLQAAFNAPVVARLHALGRTPVGWDEAIHPRLPRDVVIQAWRGTAARTRALAAGFDTVHSADYYLDLSYPADLHYLSDPEHGPGPDLVSDPRLAHVRPGLEMMHRVWTSDTATIPIEAGSGQVLGGEACMWTELVTDDLFPLRVWSRMPAIAERFWSDAAVRDVEDMYRRLTAAHALLATTGVTDLDAVTARGLKRLGLKTTDIAELTPLLAAVEPVKWYARLLGPTAMAQRTAGEAEDAATRPYNTTTELNRVVDLLPPESLAARGLARETDVRKLRETVAAWRRQRQCVQRLAATVPAIAELDGVSVVLHELADLLARFLDGEPVTVPDEAFEPRDEYVLAVAAPLAARFAA
ncbi:MAG: family 20 glycosylhydrolase [Gammaproteobacteria bacterium]|nr:family 20 glycosylhydrolase [Gammaproteobacteria bacterium]